MRNNLPIQLTRFIGRRREIADVKRLIADTRLLTMTGPGGSGKTRLAIEVARQLDETYKDGLFWVDLASIIEESVVPKAVAVALGVPEQPGRSVTEVLKSFLVNKRILLILDNCEHLIVASAQLVDGLLQTCPKLHFLATSREPLALGGEMIYPVPALSFPPPSALAERSVLERASPDLLENLGKYESITLFLDRAAAVLPGYALTPENAHSVAAVCLGLDGMPLAIELAVARVNVLTADQIADRLDAQLELLISSKRGGIARRHQTLRAAIDWSHELLTRPEQVLLRRLSVFAGGCSLATAEAVCSRDGVEREQLLHLLSSLVNKSLVVAETFRRGEARYMLLEIIRQYAAEQLQASGELTAVLDRHLNCFLQLTEETEPKLKGEYQQLWLNWLAAEYDNISKALSWSLASDQVEAGLRIATAIYLFWAIRGYVEEGSAWFERLLSDTHEGGSPFIRANSLACAAFLATFRKDVRAQMSYGREAARIAETADDVGKPALVWALASQAAGASAAGDYQMEFDLSQRIIQLTRMLGDNYQLGVALGGFSTAAMNIGKYAEARAMLEEALPLLQVTRDYHRTGMTLNCFGDLERCEQNHSQAQNYYEESMSLLREINADRDIASVKQNLGHASLHLGEVERARALFSESMTTHQAQHNRPGMAECLIGFSALAIVDGKPAAGARLLAAAGAIGGEKLTSAWPATRMDYEHYLALSGSELSAHEFELERAAGRNLPIDEAVIYALEVAGNVKSVHEVSRQPDRLTPREIEVATLIAQAKSNGEIAAELVLSKRTVETHIANIRSKLGFNERAQIVRWAIETELVDLGEQDHS